jgi:hypothetical protein
MCFALDPTAAFKYTTLFIDQKDYERLIMGHSYTPLKVKKKKKKQKKNMINL